MIFPLVGHFSWQEDRAYYGLASYAYAIVSATTTAQRGEASRVLPTFDDRSPLVLCVGMGGSAAPGARRRKVVADGQQCALPLRKSRIRIIECRQDPHHTTRFVPISSTLAVRR